MRAVDLLRTLFFLAVPLALLLGAVLAVLLAAVRDAHGARWRWLNAAAAALLVAGIVWVAVAVTRVDRYRAPAEITLWDLMEADTRWWVVVAMAAGLTALAVQIAALVPARRGARRLRTWSMPVAATGMFLLFSVFFVLLAVGSH